MLMNFEDPEPKLPFLNFAESGRKVHPLNFALKGHYHKLF
jgi:hypothetical protein